MDPVAEERNRTGGEGCRVGVDFETEKKVEKISKADKMHDFAKKIRREKVEEGKFNILVLEAVYRKGGELVWESANPRARQRRQDEKTAQTGH